MTTAEHTRNQSASQNQDHSPEGADEKLSLSDSLSGFEDITWEELLREFITPEKKSAADSQSLMERWLKKFAPFRAQAEVPRAAAPNKVGRPTVLTAAVKNQLYILLSLGMTRKQAAWYLGFDPSTVSHAAKNDEDFSHELTRAEQLSGLQPHLALQAASLSNWRAAVWVIEHQNQKGEGDEESAERTTQKRRKANRGKRGETA